MVRSRSAVSPSPRGIGWRSQRSRGRARETTVERPTVGLGVYHFMRMAGIVLITVGVCILAISFLVQETPTIGEHGTASLPVILSVAGPCALVIILSVEASRASKEIWTWIAVTAGCLNVLLAPWVYCVVLAIPAPIAMPPLMFSSWASFAAVGFLLAIKMGRIQPTSVSTAIVGGSVGLAGFSLLLNQFVNSGTGHEVTVPILPTAETASAEGARSLLDEETQLSVRYDEGPVQLAYVDKGSLHVTRPVYFHVVRYTVTLGNPVGMEISDGRRMIEQGVYADALRSIFTMNLSKSHLAGFTVNDVNATIETAR